MDGELQKYRAVESERQKWEAREERLLHQLQLAQEAGGAAKTEERDPEGGEAVRQCYESQLSALKSELMEARRRLEETEDLQLKCEEQDAQIRLLHTQLRRVQAVSGVVPEYYLTKKGLTDGRWSEIEQPTRTAVPGMDSKACGLVEVPRVSDTEPGVAAQSSLWFAQQLPP